MNGNSASEIVRDRLRARMPVSERFAYFDHAAVAPLTSDAGQAIEQYVAQSRTHGDVVWLEWAAGIQRVRECAAELLNAQLEEIALVNNTTQGIHLVAEGLPWEPGDNVVVPQNEFPSNLVPWRNLRRRGVEVREVPVPDSGEVSMDRLEDAMDVRTRILAISWVGFSSGYRLDVKQAVERAHQRGCLVLLDAIQGLGAFSLDVVETGVDFVCADGHKWMLGPEGAGLFYVKAEHLKQLTPLGIGWNSLKAGAFESSSKELKAAAARYEGGTYNMPGMLGFGASLELLLQLKSNQPSGPLADAILDNVALVESKLSTGDYRVHVPEQRRHRSGIVGITWPGGNAVAYAAARRFLLDRDVVSSVRGDRLRVSTHAYNNEQDVRRLVDGLNEYRAITF